MWFSALVGYFTITMYLKSGLIKGMTFSGSGLIGVMVSLKGEYCSLDCCIKILFQNVFEFNVISIRYKRCTCILQKLILIYFLVIFFLIYARNCMFYSLDPLLSAREKENKT
jgi:hypothetical protein